MRLLRIMASFAELPEPPPPADGRSIRTTSAPRSPRIIAACGPGPIPASSTTRSPLRGPLNVAAMIYRPFVCSDVLDPFRVDNQPFASLQPCSPAAHPGHLG